MSLSRKTGLAGIALLSSATYATAQMAPGHHSGMPDVTGMAEITRQAGLTPGQPTSPGQDAFGAIQEIVSILDLDPNTDWSKVDIAALREHLIDMNEVTLHAVANELPLPTAWTLRSPAKGAHLRRSSGWFPRTPMS